jgi:hypothetical protein
VAVLAGCGGGDRRGRAEAHAATPIAPDVTAEAKEGGGTLVRMAGTFRSWRLDPGVRNQLVGQIGYVVNAPKHDSRLGAKALFDAWR